MDRHADTRGESRLLRLALAKGLLRWEDLDRLEDQDLTQDLSAHRAPRDLAAAQEEAEAPAGSAAAATPPGDAEPWPSWQGLRFDPPPGEASGASAPAAPGPAGDVRFLSGWERYRV